MKYLLNTEKLALAVALFLGMSVTPSIANDEKVREVDIQSCFALEHDNDAITSQTAFEIAECFSNLADSIVDHQTDEFKADDALWVWDDKNVLLHYADSWFSYAAFKGHPDAKVQLKHTRSEFKH